jgi:hypothetical protein
MPTSHIASRYHPVPNKPKTALITLSTTERPLNIDQPKSAKAQSENTSRTPLALTPRCFFVSFMSETLCHPVNWQEQATALKTLFAGVGKIPVGIPLARYPPDGPGRALVSASGSYLG